MDNTHRGPALDLGNEGLAQAAHTFASLGSIWPVVEILDLGSGCDGCWASFLDQTPVGSSVRNYVHVLELDAYWSFGTFNGCGLTS